MELEYPSSQDCYSRDGRRMATENPTWNSQNIQSPKEIVETNRPNFESNVFKVSFHGLRWRNEKEESFDGWSKIPF